MNNQKIHENFFSVSICQKNVIKKNYKNTIFTQKIGTFFNMMMSNAGGILQTLLIKVYFVNLTASSNVKNTQILLTSNPISLRYVLQINAHAHIQEQINKCVNGL